jgi:nucleotide-binding universal stress UspA family protein
MKTIIVPTDYSENAWNAAEYAAALARRTHARLIIYHAFVFPVILTEVSTYEFISLEEMRNEHLEKLSELQQKLVEKYRIDVECESMPGSLTDEMEGFFEKSKADIVVMGLRGNNPLSNLVMGSATSYFLQKACFPMLIIPHKALFQTIDRILFACNSHFVANPATLKPMQDIAASFNARVEVLTVGEPVLAGIEEEQPGNLERLLDTIKHNYTYLEGNDVEATISQEIENIEADMLVMIPRKLSLISHLLERSHTHAMAFLSEVPLLALPEVK